MLDPLPQRALVNLDLTAQTFYQNGRNTPEQENHMKYIGIWAVWRAKTPEVKI